METKTINRLEVEFFGLPKRKKRIKSIFMLCMWGGSTMGYKLAGCEVLGCCEIDPEMNDIYIKNHNPKYNYLMDIRDFNNLDDLPEELYELDILDGSPPCTTFSMAGDREKSWGKIKKFREGQQEQTLDDLSFVFIDTVKKLKPKTVIMENVEGILRGNAWDYVMKIYKGFDEAGYYLNHWLLKGENMGIPQKRHRVFFIAIRKDQDITIDQLDLTFNYRPIIYSEIVSGKGQQIRRGTQTEAILNMATEKHKSLANVFKDLGEKERCFNDVIVWKNDIMPTIRASFSCYRGEEKTTVSIEDIIHAQTFPEDFNFNRRTLGNVGYICGMSVPPVMIKRIVERLIESGLYKKGE